MKLHRITFLGHTIVHNINRYRFCGLDFVRIFMYVLLLSEFSRTAKPDFAVFLFIHPKDF